MEKIITIISFDLPHEAHMAKTKLESEGVRVFLKDELTVQVDNFISNAVGGVKLQVFESDVENARGILQEAGYIRIEQESKDIKNTFLSVITSKIPIIRNLVFEVRLLIIVAFLTIVTIVPIVILSLPTKIEMITGETWYLNGIEYNEKYYKPNTIGLKMVFTNGDSENIKFYENGNVRMPGFNTPTVIGKWKLENDQLIIFESDTLNFIYDGSYDLNVTSNAISLKSKSTKIVGRISRVNLF